MDGIVIFKSPGDEGRGDEGYCAGEWGNRWFYHFDNIFTTFLTLFVLSVGEDWAIIMWNSMCILGEWFKAPLLLPQPVQFFFFALCSVRCSMVGSSCKSPPPRPPTMHRNNTTHARYFRFLI